MCQKMTKKCVFCLFWFFEKSIAFFCDLKPSKTKSFLKTLAEVKNVFFSTSLYISVNFCNFVYFSVDYCEFCSFFRQNYGKAQKYTEIYKNA